MTALWSPGFLTPQPGRIKTAAQMVLSRGVVQADTVLEDWDYSADVSVQLDLHVDLEGVCADIGVSGEVKLAALIHWNATGSNLRGAGPATVVKQGNNTLRLDLPGGELGGVLTLSPRVVLKGADVFGPLSPRRCGSTLWSDQIVVTLEGGGARLPTMPVPFSRLGIGAGGTAAWALSVENADLEASASSSILLYLNTEHPRVAEMLSDQPTPETAVLLDFIEYDVTRQLVMRALDTEDLYDSYQPSAGSLGEALLNVIRRLFPGRSLVDLRHDRNISPGDLEAALQAVVNLPLRVEQ